MRNTITYIYVSNLDNVTVVVDTSLMPFVSDLKRLEPGVRDYHYFSRQFKKSNVLQYEISGKPYTLQRISVNEASEPDAELTNPK